MVQDGEKKDTDRFHCKTFTISYKPRKGIGTDGSVGREYSRPHDRTTHLRDLQDVETEQRCSQAHSQAFARGLINSSFSLWMNISSEYKVPSSINHRSSIHISNPQPPPTISSDIPTLPQPPNRTPRRRRRRRPARNPHTSASNNR